MALAHCSHCGTSFTPDNGVTLDDCPKCGRTVEVKPAPAPLPKVVAEALRRFAQDCPTCTDTVHNHISDLTRRVAEAEAELAEVRRRNGMLAVQRADAVHLAKASPTQAYQRIQQFKERAEAAEAKVSDLTSTIDAMAEAHAHDDMALTAAYLSGAHEGKKQAEAFKTRVMEWAQGRCECCESWESDKMCLTCIRCTCLGTMASTKEADNWTPPQAWKVNP